MLFQLQGIHMAILSIKIQSILLQEILQLLKIWIREFLSMIQFRAKNSEAVKF
jgi:choline kinase